MVAALTKGPLVEGQVLIEERQGAALVGVAHEQEREAAAALAGELVVGGDAEVFEPQLQLGEVGLEPGDGLGRGVVELGEAARRRPGALAVGDHQGQHDGQARPLDLLPHPHRRA